MTLISIYIRLIILPQFIGNGTLYAFLSSSTFFSQPLFCSDVERSQSNCHFFPTLLNSFSCFLLQYDETQFFISTKLNIVSIPSKLRSNYSLHFTAVQLDEIEQACQINSKQSSFIDDISIFFC